MPDDDDLADKYLLADELLTAAGLRWYEVSNWAGDDEPRAAGTTCSTGPARDWWGVGPGAHSHVGGVRWWNVKHPTAYADRIGAGLPGARPRDARRRVATGRAGAARAAPERRARAVDVLDDGRAAVPELARRGLLEPGDPLVLTTRGRLLADAVVRDLLP